MTPASRLASRCRLQADPRFTPAEGIRQLRLRLPKRARRRLPLLMLDKAEARRVRLRIVKTRSRLSDKECSACLRVEMHCVGRSWQTPRLLTETPYNSNYSPTLFR